MGFGFGSSSSGPVDMTPGAFKELQPFLADQLRLLSGGGPSFGGPFAAPLSGLEQNALGKVQDFGLNLSPNQRLGDENLGATLRGEFLDPSTNPGLQASIDAAIRPILSAFDEGELANRALFTRSGQKIQESSPFSQAQARLSEGLVNAIGDTTGRLVNQNFQAERNRQFAAIGQAGAQASARFDAARQSLEAAALPRLVEQLGIDGGLAEFQRRMDMIRDILAITAQVSQPVIGTQSKSTNTDVDLSLL